MQPLEGVALKKARFSIDLWVTVVVASRENYDALWVNGDLVEHAFNIVHDSYKLLTKAAQHTKLFVRSLP